MVSKPSGRVSFFILFFTFGVPYEDTLKASFAIALTFTPLIFSGITTSVGLSGFLKPFRVPVALSKSQMLVSTTVTSTLASAPSLSFNLNQAFPPSTPLIVSLLPFALTSSFFFSLSFIITLKSVVASSLASVSPLIVYSLVSSTLMLLSMFVVTIFATFFSTGLSFATTLATMCNGLTSLPPNLVPYVTVILWVPSFLPTTLICVPLVLDSRTPSSSAFHFISVYSSISSPKSMSSSDH